MDVRTSQLLKVVDAAAAELLLILLERDLSEKELVGVADGLPQPTVHKKLGRLAEAGVIKQGAYAPGRGSPWSVVAPKEVASFLAALFGLADALDQADASERAQARGRIAKAQAAAKPDLRIVAPDR
jgi:DNA-binding transcriptional ArsR family regulator